MRPDARTTARAGSLLRSRRRGPLLGTGIIILLLVAASLVIWAASPERGRPGTAASAPPAPPSDEGAASGSAATLPGSAALAESCIAGDLPDAVGAPEHEEFTAAGSTSTYQVFTEGVDLEHPAGVVIRLHGDGIDEREDQDALNACLAAVAASTGRILVVPQTPDTDENPTWWEDLDTNREWLAALVGEHLPEEYDLDRDDLWWTGYSGGAEMMSYGILATNPALVTGGALMIGGGGAEDLVPQPATESRQDVPLTWAVGEQDDGSDPGSDEAFDALTAAEEGADCYLEAGYRNVELQVLPDVDHFDIPQARLLAELLEDDGA